MCAVFLNWKDSGHVSEGNIVLIFQPHPEKIEVFFLRILILLVFTKQTVPFINKDDERMLCGSINIFHDLYKICFVAVTDCFIRICQIKNHIFLDSAKHVLNTV